MKPNLGRLWASGRSLTCPLSAAPCIVPTIEYGRLKNRTLAGALVTHGSVIEVECDERYELAYSLAPSLCYNGTWTHYPRCQPGG